MLKAAKNKGVLVIFVIILSNLDWMLCTNIIIIKN